MKPAIKEAVSKMGLQQREEFEERAAIYEYDANLDRQLAEFLALKHITSNIHGTKVVR